MPVLFTNPRRQVFSRQGPYELLFLVKFQYVTVRLEQDQILCHGGSTDPCASVILYSIGGVSGAANKQHTCTLGEAVAKELGIKQDRYSLKITC